MTVTKYLTYVASTPANTTELTQQITQDDNQDRHLVGILTGDATKLNRTQIQLSGKVVVDIDNSLMGQQKDFIPLDVTFKAGVFFFLGTQNGTAGAVDNIPITIKYEVPN